MGYDLLLSIIEQLGYVALFLVLCLGLIGLPIPNEAVVMTGGALAFSGVLSPVPAFIMTCLGICSAMSFGYSIGRFAGARLANWFRKRKNIGAFIDRSEELSHRFGGYAISISLCLPFLRHVTPYVMGMNKMKYGRFALFAYPSAFVWTMIYFLIGGFVGDQVQHIADVIYRYGIWIIVALAIVAAAYFVYRVQKRNKVRGQDSSIERQM
ncbi:DedA family protein [Paenibacillus sp. PAMC21692]|uniref:DedA family protein n=1 Tax=Paenibacillus sp. PAMC21692 TaxID=2762320 RepID=UPI00164DD95F|nr:DedA family protein [Paenibacillus sp. PAMC21692]QNK54948.1 DedA family protein [Paenibacillus sp. PAMC21692]